MKINRILISISIFSISILTIVSSALTNADTIPPASITGLKNISCGQDYINWTWKDPSNPDFAKVMVYINGKLKTNISKGKQYYKATGLAYNTIYKINTHTVDTSGNINKTWVNNSAKTADLKIGWSAMFGNFVEYVNIDSDDYYGEVLNVSFYLPVDSYLYVSSSGVLFTNLPLDYRPMINVWVDSITTPDWGSHRFSDGSSFSISDIFKLKKGYHTAYLILQKPSIGYVDLSGTNIVVMATQKGGGKGWHEY